MSVEHSEQDPQQGSAAQAANQAALKREALEAFEPAKRPAAANILDQTWIFKPPLPSEAPRYRLLANEPAQILSVVKSVEALGYEAHILHDRGPAFSGMGNAGVTYGAGGKVTGLTISVDAMKELKDAMPTLKIWGGPAVSNENELDIASR